MGQNYTEYRNGSVEADPYSLALWTAIKDAPIEEVDAILEAFPDREEWEAKAAQVDASVTAL